MSFERENVGTADAWARRGIAVALLAFVAWASSHVAPEWYLTVLLHPAILAAYMLTTATARACFLYEAIGFSSLRERAPRGARTTTPPRSMGPPRGSY